MCLPTTKAGYMGAIAWCVGQRIFDGIDAGGYQAHIPKPADTRTDAQIFADYCAKIRARKS